MDLCCGLQEVPESMAVKVVEASWRSGTVRSSLHMLKSKRNMKTGLKSLWFSMVYCCRRKFVGLCRINHFCVNRQWGRMWTSKSDQRRFNQKLFLRTFCTRRLLTQRLFTQKPLLVHTCHLHTFHPEILLAHTLQPYTLQPEIRHPETLLHTLHSEASRDSSPRSSSRTYFLPTYFALRDFPVHTFQP